MTKKMLTTKLDDVKYALDGCTLEEVLHKVKQWIQLYGGNTKFEIGQESEEYSYSDKEYAYVRLVGQREESDEAYQKRLADEAERTARQEAYDKKELERLLKKFAETK
jgi:hypothetical protein